MMLDFIFNYTWIVMLIIGWIIWGIVSIKDIIKTVRTLTDSFEFSDLDESTQGWILMSLISILVASFAHWLVYVE